MNGEPELVGRERELGLIRSWVEDPAVWPAALVVRGDAGIGKTSLWQAAVERAHAQGLLVLVSRAIQAEMPLGYAALGDLFESVETSVLSRLPDPLARDLEVALLRRAAGQPSTPLAVARATLEAFRMLADTCPVLVAIDDVQWLDPASARVLAFAARRLRRQPVGFALSLRDGHEDPLACHEAFGESVLELQVKGLTLGATGRLLRTRVDPQTTRRAVARVHERSGGNPFFALHLGSAPADEPLPESLREVISAQLLHASPAAVEAIELSAIRGPSPTRAYANPSSLAAAIEEGVLVERQRGGAVHPPLAGSGGIRADRGGPQTRAAPRGRRHGRRSRDQGEASGPRHR